MSTLKNRHQDESFCPQYHHAVELIGRRWAGAILRAMLFGATRFSEIADAIPALSDKMLAQRLKELEAEGIVLRNVVPDTPVRIEYTLTEKGRALDAAIEALSLWADRWVPDPDAPEPVDTLKG
jgi:DNA-binding HxlR family transcriptional regulator